MIRRGTLSTLFLLVAFLLPSLTRAQSLSVPIIVQPAEWTGMVPTDVYANAASPNYCPPYQNNQIPNDTGGPTANEVCTLTGTRTNAPVTFGLGIPDSAQIDCPGMQDQPQNEGSPTSLALYSGASKVPYQARCMGRYPDGYAQWVLIDAQIASLTELGSSGGTGYDTSLTLKQVTAGTGGNYPASSPIAVDSNAGNSNSGSITVTTGAATFIVNKSNFIGIVSAILTNGCSGPQCTLVAAGNHGPYDGFYLQGPPNSTIVSPSGGSILNVSCAPALGGLGGTSVYPNASGPLTFPLSYQQGGGPSLCNTAYDSNLDANSTAIIEENGPLRAVVKGMFTFTNASGQGYTRGTARFTFWKNRSDVKVTFDHRNADVDGTCCKTPNFSNAYKEFSQLEYRLTDNLGAPSARNWAFSNDTATPDSGTGMASTQSAFLFEAHVQDGQWPHGEAGQANNCPYIKQNPTNGIFGATGDACSMMPIPRSGPATDREYATEGYITKNPSGAIIRTGSNIQYPVGWGDLDDGTNGIEFGVYEFPMDWPKSLEIQPGAVANHNEIRIGLRPDQTEFVNAGGVLNPMFSQGTTIQVVTGQSGNTINVGSTGSGGAAISNGENVLVANYSTSATLVVQSFVANTSITFTSAPPASLLQASWGAVNDSSPTVSYVQAWPQYKENDFLLNFHAGRLNASNYAAGQNAFLYFEHYLLARPQAGCAYYNTVTESLTGDAMLDYPCPDPVVEDTYYQGLGTLGNTVSGGLCGTTTATVMNPAFASGVLPAGSCLGDVNGSNYPWLCSSSLTVQGTCVLQSTGGAYAYYWGMKNFGLFFGWGTAGPIDWTQTDGRDAFDRNFEQRGCTPLALPAIGCGAASLQGSLPGRFIMVDNFSRMLVEKAFFHSDMPLGCGEAGVGPCIYSGPNAGFRSLCTSLAVCNPLDFQPWGDPQNGAVPSVWNGGMEDCGDCEDSMEHSSYYGIALHYFLTGRETERETILEGLKDRYMNPFVPWNNIYAQGSGNATIEGHGRIPTVRAPAHWMSDEAMVLRFLNSLRDPDMDSLTTAVTSPGNSPAGCTYGNPAHSTNECPTVAQSALQNLAINSIPFDMSGFPVGFCEASNVTYTYTTNGQTINCGISPSSMGPCPGGACTPVGSPYIVNNTIGWPCQALGAPVALCSQGTSWTSGYLRSAGGGEEETGKQGAKISSGAGTTTINVMPTINNQYPLAGLTTTSSVNFSNGAGCTPTTLTPTSFSSSFSGGQYAGVINFATNTPANCTTLLWAPTAPPSGLNNYRTAESFQESLRTKGLYDIHNALTEVFQTYDWHIPVGVPSGMPASPSPANCPGGTPTICDGNTPGFASVMVSEKGLLDQVYGTSLEILEMNALQYGQNFSAPTYATMGLPYDISPDWLNQNPMCPTTSSCGKGLTNTTTQACLIGCGALTSWMGMSGVAATTNSITDLSGNQWQMLFESQMSSSVFQQEQGSQLMDFAYQFIFGNTAAGGTGYPTYTVGSTIPTLKPLAVSFNVPGGCTSGTNTGGAAYIVCSGTPTITLSWTPPLGLATVHGSQYRLKYFPCKAGVLTIYGQDCPTGGKAIIPDLEYDPETTTCAQYGSPGSCVVATDSQTGNQVGSFVNDPRYFWNSWATPDLPDGVSNTASVSGSSYAFVPQAGWTYTFALYAYTTGVAPPPPTPAFSCSPTAYAFGSVTSGGSVGPTSLTCANNLGFNVILAAPTSSDSTDFPLTGTVSNPCSALSGNLLANGASCNVPAKFTPSTTGALSSTVTQGWSTTLGGGTNHNAASCSAADVQTAINAAADGDTVTVPTSGNCATLGAAPTWNTAVTVTKGITLNGASAYIKFGTSGSLSITADTVANAFVENFNFNNGFINGGCPITFVTNSTAGPVTKAFRFFDNTYLDNGGQGAQVTLLCVNGFGPGVIDHDTFTTDYGADEVIHLLGAGAGNASGWANDVVPGGPNMTFIETDTFTNGNTGVTTSAEEAYYGAQFAFRNNILNFEQNDVHGGPISARWSEIYDNTYNITGTTTNLPNYTQTRGGAGVYWGNTSSGTPCCSDPYPSTEFGPLGSSSDPDTGPWPLNYQVGRGINNTYTPYYAWGNGSPIQANITSSNPTYVQIGTAPTDATHCTGHPADVCDAVATATQPTNLERCESAADVSATCPVQYTYAQYPYPHPLTTNSGSATVALTGTGISTGSLTISPNPGNFSSQTVGTASTDSPKAFQVNNATGSTQSGSQSQTGTNAADFTTQAGAGECGATIANGVPCNIYVTFIPSIVGAETATLNWGSASATMNGTGLATQTMTVVPSSLSYSIAAGTNQTQGITLTNTGSGSITLTSFTLSDTTRYSYTTSCGGTLAVGGNCTVAVEFAPTVTGTFNGTLTLVNSAVSSPQTVNLFGTAIGAPTVPTGLLPKAH